MPVRCGYLHMSYSRKSTVTFSSLPISRRAGTTQLRSLLEPRMHVVIVKNK